MDSAQLTSDRQYRYKSLDALRGLAALVVVFYHCALTISGFAPALWFGDRRELDRFGQLLTRLPLRILLSGQSSVLVFFVLSGFVLSLPWLNGRADRYERFLIKRICRIYVPYIVAIFLSTILMSAVSSRDFPSSSPWLQTAGWIRSLSLSMILDHVGMIGKENYIDNVVWSLIYEMRISLLFPLLVIPAVRFGWKGCLLVGISASVLRWAVGHAGFGYGGQTAAATLAYGSLFELGILVALYRARIQQVLLHVPRPVPLVAIAVVLLVLAADWQGWNNIVRGFAAALLVGLALSPGLISRVLLSRACVWLGKISYSLYLLHLPILLTLVYSFSSRIGMLPCILLAIPLSIAAAAVYYRLVEAPSIRLGRRLAKNVAAGSPSQADEVARARPARTARPR